jgi:hypothetical protein
MLPVPAREVARVFRGVRLASSLGKSFQNAWKVIVAELQPF